MGRFFAPPRRCLKALRSAWWAACGAFRAIEAAHRRGEVDGADVESARARVAQLKADADAAAEKRRVEKARRRKVRKHG